MQSSNRLIESEISHRVEVYRDRRSNDFVFKHLCYAVISFKAIHPSDVKDKANFYFIHNVIEHQEVCTD